MAKVEPGMESMLEMYIFETNTLLNSSMKFFSEQRMQMYSRRRTSTRYSE